MTLARKRKLALFLPLWVSAALIAVYLAWILGVGRPGNETLIGDVVYNLTLVCAAAACLGRAWLWREDRGAWLAFGLGLLCWTAGSVYYSIALADLPEIPYPSLADAGYIAVYPLFYLGIGLLLRRRVGRFTAAVWLDGLIGALASAAVATAVLSPALLGLTHGDPAAVATNLAYPLGDLLLLGFIAAALVVTGTRRHWVLLGVGIAVWTAADSIYLYTVASGSYTEGTVADAFWPLGGLIMAAAGVIRLGPVNRRAGSGSIVLPCVFALSSVGVLVWDHFQSMEIFSVSLAATTIVLVVVRLALTFEENRRLIDAVKGEALTDSLTGLPNRRLLLRDLGLLLDSGDEPAPSVLAMFDLDGFKAYNDSFGHPAGDLLLRRLGQSLAEAVRPHGVAYRLGGDEFCVLASGDPSRFESLVASGRAALTDEGAGFVVAPSAGSVRIPFEAAEEGAVLHLADERMYLEKGRRSCSVVRQTRDVLLRILEEREPTLSEHLKGTARLSGVIGRRLGLDAEELDVLVRAAELHDIGKIAIPDNVLHKPGALDAQEWDLLHAHTLIGERILGSAPAMVPAARLVRSSHERWDGTGYPDGLAGTAIPLGARIIFTCDAFDAITTERPYRSARTPAEAVAELRANAGSQFDPEIAELFCSALEAGELSAEPLAVPAG